MNNTAIITCAGNSTRSQLKINKVLFKIDGITALEKCIKAFQAVENDMQIIITANNTDFDQIDKIAQVYGATTVLGGETRTQSVKNALEIANGEIVLIHDGARPFVSTDLIKRCLDGVRENKSAICAVRSVDTLGVVDGTVIKQTVRDGYYKIQTPQGFHTADVKRAYALSGNEVFTDDSAVYSKFIAPCHIIEGETQNQKLTYPSDFAPLQRVGTGFDLHRLVEGRKLILGGVEIAHSKGLLGHSDADVLTHAIMDALLSAASLRDIGYHFPDTDPKYKGACSIDLLKEVLNLLGKQGYRVHNVSACIMAEKPKLKALVPQITQNLCNVLQIPTADLGITCTTLEGIGIVGREEGIAVSANCSIIRI